jgi:Acyl-CoA thioester hydrolase/BAAT N-terminal region.
MKTNNARIYATPTTGLVDTDVSVVLSGFHRNSLVRIDAVIDVAAGHRLSSTATFFTDIHGRVDLSQQAPLSGSYHRADPHGLIWSMTIDHDHADTGSGTNAVRGFANDDLRPYAITFTASDGHNTASTNIIRTILAPGVSRVEIENESISGVLFLPPGRGRFARSFSSVDPVAVWRSVVPRSTLPMGSQSWRSDTFESQEARCQAESRRYHSSILKMPLRGLRPGMSC